MEWHVSSLFAWTWLKLLGMNPWWNSSRNNLHQTHASFSNFFRKLKKHLRNPRPKFRNRLAEPKFSSRCFFFCVGDNDGEGPCVVFAAVPNGDRGRPETSGWRRMGRMGGNCGIEWFEAGGFGISSKPPKAASTPVKAFAEQQAWSSTTSNKTSPQVKSSTQRRGQRNLTVRLQTKAASPARSHIAETLTAPSKRGRRKSPNTVAPTDVGTVATDTEDQTIEDILAETTEQPTIPPV